jgi:hypothetical protein
VAKHMVRDAAPSVCCVTVHVMLATALAIGRTTAKKTKRLPLIIQILVDNSGQEKRYVYVGGTPYTLACFRM